MQALTTAKVEFVSYLPARTASVVSKRGVAWRCWQPFSPPPPPLIAREGRGKPTGRKGGGRAIYRLPLIEDDDLTRSYNRLGIAINDLFCSVGTVYVTSTTARLKRGGGREGRGEEEKYFMREPARTSPRPLAISLARRISRESDSNDRRFLYRFFSLSLYFRIYGGRERERCLCVYIYIWCMCRWERTGLISFSSDRRGGLNFAREYDWGEWIDARSK